MVEYIKNGYELVDINVTQINISESTDQELFQEISDMILVMVVKDTPENEEYFNKLKDERKSRGLSN